MKTAITRHLGESLGAVEPRGLALASSGWITLLGVQFLPSGSIPRILLVVGFLLVCPGLAVVAHLPEQDPAERLTVAVAVSMSLSLLTSVAFTVMSNGSLSGRLAVLAGITTVAVVAGWAGAGRRRRPVVGEELECHPPEGTINAHH